MGSCEGKCLGEWVIVSGSVFLCWAVVLFSPGLNALQVSMDVPFQWPGGSLGSGDKPEKGTCQTFGRVVSVNFCFLNLSTAFQSYNHFSPRLFKCSKNLPAKCSIQIITSRCW